MNYIIKVNDKYYMGKEFKTNNIVLNENVVHAQRFTNYKEVKQVVSELELIKGSKIKIIGGINDMKTIIIEDSKYKIEYDSNEIWNFKIFQGNEDVTKELKFNVMSDIVINLIENIENGIELKGFKIKL